MKKTVLSFTLFFLSFLSFGQGRIGFTAEEIMAEFPNYKFVHGVTFLAITASAKISI